MNDLEVEEAEDADAEITVSAKGIHGDNIHGMSTRMPIVAPPPVQDKANLINKLVVAPKQDTIQTETIINYADNVDTTARTTQSEAAATLADAADKQNEATKNAQNKKIQGHPLDFHAIQIPKDDIIIIDETFVTINDINEMIENDKSSKSNNRHQYLELLEPRSAPQNSQSSRSN
eukprot:jgi/Psemu1/19033/gm1.19033_g